MGDSLTRAILLVLNRVPLICRFSQKLLQDSELLARLKKFMAVGIPTSAAQLAFLAFLNSMDVGWLWALILTSGPATIISYTLSREVIWADRIVAHEKWRVVLYVAMYFKFLSTKWTTLFKTPLIALMHWVGIPVLLGWVIAQGLGAGFSFVTAEKFVFASLNLKGVRRSRKDTCELDQSIKDSPQEGAAS